MSSPCEILVRCENAGEAEKLASLAFIETTRIEQKFSRYRDDNIVWAINHRNGGRVEVDEETSQLLQYAGHCFELSEGLFDITSGVLRRAWTFNGADVKPDVKQIASLRRLVGWDKVQFDGAGIRMLRGMEIDFGGLGKEYAVDKVAQLLFDADGVPLMVNFGGDVRAISTDPQSQPWAIGIENPAREDAPIGMIPLRNGAIATSGVSRRFCYVRGQRLSHILDPRTGWPVEDPPLSVTVIGDFCMEAGLLTTLAMLHGKHAERFLSSQQVVNHCVR